MMMSIGSLQSIEQSCLRGDAVVVGDVTDELTCAQTAVVDVRPALHPLEREAAGELVLEGQLLPAPAVQRSLHQSPAIRFADVIRVRRRRAFPLTALDNG